jgi:hypothetical protein
VGTAANRRVSTGACTRSFDGDSACRSHEGLGSLFLVPHPKCKHGAQGGRNPPRVGDTEHMRLYGRHVASGVRPEYHGNHFAGRALRLLGSLARRHGRSELWITCNPENIASRRTCEFAGHTWTCIRKASVKSAGASWICGQPNALRGSLIPSHGYGAAWTANPPVGLVRYRA